MREVKTVLELILLRNPFHPICDKLTVFTAETAF